MKRPDIFQRPPPLWALILLALALWGGEYARRGLWEPDEARYAYVAREMRAGDHWWVPHINGNPYPDKPPLMFWLINAASLLTGGRINGISARLPSMLGSLMTLWVVARLLTHWAGARAAWRGVLILMTSFLFWQEGGWGRIDALLCGLIMLSLYCLLRHHTGGANLPWAAPLDQPSTCPPTNPLDHPPARGDWRFLLAAYLLAGLAVLAKGPVGLLLPLGIYAAMVWAQGEAPTLRRWHWLWGSALACAIPGFWLWMAWRQNAPSEYFQAMFGAKSFGRITASTGHNQPFYYFLWHFPLEFLPWTLFLPGALASLPNRALRRRLLAWGGFVILLFSLFVCKRNVYILPAFPAAAMLVAAGWEDARRLPQRLQTATAWSLLSLIALLAVALTLAMALPQVPVGPGALLPSAAVLWLGGALLLRCYRREGLSPRWLGLVCALLFANEMALTSFLLPALDPLKTPQAFAEAVQGRVPPGEPVYIFKNQLAIIPLYADRPGRRLDSVEALNRLLTSGHHPVVVLHQRQWNDIQSQVALPGNTHPFPMGHKKLVWVDFAAPPPAPPVLVPL